MSDTTSKQFGLLVAYVLPGFILLAGLAPVLPTVARWLMPVNQGDLGIGPPVYAVLGATAMGQILSCFRWLLLDHLHLWMGVRRPAWNDRQLTSTLGSFDYLVQNHYRYYEFCGNSLLALLAAYSINRFLVMLPFLGVGTDVGMVILILVLFAASRDALAKYYSRTGRLIGDIAEKENGDLNMYNGNDHGGAGKPAEQPKPQEKPQPAQATGQPREDLKPAPREK